MTPNTPRYRAILIDKADTKQERPVQIFGNDWKLIEEWQSLILASAHEGAVVIAFETVETRVKIFTRPAKEKAEPAAK